MISMDLFRVAVVQAGSVPFDRERSTMKALNLIGQAIRTEARLIVFPEAFISGYPKGGLISGHASGCDLLKGASGSAPISRVPLRYPGLKWKRLRRPHGREARILSSASSSATVAHYTALRYSSAQMDCWASTAS
jgi:hypothetical protein